MEGEFALFVGRREGPERAGEKRAMVGLQRQGVMAPLGADLFGHTRVAMQGVGGDDAALQGHGFQRRQGRRHFVAAGRMAGRQRQARLGVPDADHQRRHEGAAALVAAAQALAVDGHHAFGRRKPEFRAQRRVKPGEGRGHFLRIEQAEEAAEAVVARRAVRQIDDLGVTTLSQQIPIELAIGGFDEQCLSPIPPLSDVMGQVGTTMRESRAIDHPYQRSTEIQLISRPRNPP